MAPARTSTRPPPTHRWSRGRHAARPGIARIVEQAAAAGWQLAVASTSAEPAVRAVLEHAVGVDRARDFAVFAGDVVPAKKPDPAIYRLAVKELAVQPNQAVVIEDSSNGLRAALGTGLACVVTVSTYTAGEDFTGAALVVTSLGDPDGEQTTVLADPPASGPEPACDWPTCRRCWSGGARKVRSRAISRRTVPTR